MNLILLAARLLLAIVFAAAGLAKLVDRAGSQKLAVDFGIPQALSGVFAWLLPLAELSCAVALIPAASAWWGAVGVAVMLSIFIVAIGVSLARGRRPDCHCFGQLHSSPIGWTTLARNAALAGIAAMVIWQGRDAGGAGMLDWMYRLSRSQRIELGLVAAVAVVALSALAMTYQLLRQNGRLLLRLEALETRLGVAAEPPAPGLPVNSVAPGFSVSDLDGRTVTLDALGRRSASLLLFFAEPGCGACDAMLPELASWQRDHRDRVLIVPISRGDVGANREKAKKHKLQHLVLQRDREVAEAYRVDATPGGVLVNDGRVVSSVAVGADAIRALVLQATAPEPLKNGEPVPSLQLPDLDGRSVDLAKLKGRRTLLVFWDPACGFCQQMLGDLTQWERSREPDAPALVVISKGAVAVNREQGLKSHVLLDATFAAGSLFGAGGTPSAVLIDEKGKVASDVAVGAVAVFALAGTESVKVRELAVAGARA